MPVSRTNLKAPRRGFYQVPLSISQKRQLEKISTSMEEEIAILRQQIQILLEQIEGLGYYTDIDLGKLAMIDRLINTLSRLIQRGRKNAKNSPDLEDLLSSALNDRDEPWNYE